MTELEQAIGEETADAAHAEVVQGQAGESATVARDVDTGGGDFVGRDKISHYYGEIIVRLDTIEELPPAAGAPPFKGLSYYTEKDAEIFFGRQHMTRKVTDRLQETRFLALVGASGSGKSSLLRAGVVPVLRQQKWLIHTLTPTAHPLRQLANSLARDDDSLAAAGELREILAQEPQALAQAADKLAARQNAPRLLLLVDQFEELFTLCKEDAERQAFLTCLLQASAAGGTATILVGLRADFYDRCLKYEGLRAVMEADQVTLGQMTEAELLQVVAEPAKRGSWQFVEGLVEQILEDVGQEPGRLPLLSHALLETWERRRGRVMTLAGYRAAGGVEGAIAHTAEETLGLFPAEQIPVVRRIFLLLTELGQDAESTRRIASRGELARMADIDTVGTVLETLVRRRLVTVDGDRLQVAHEALIRRWPRLQEWLKDNREQLRFERQLARDAAAWQKLDQDPGALYRGARLAQALEMMESRILQPAALPLQFLAASRTLAEREAQEAEERRQRELAQQRALATEQRQRAEAEALSANRLRLMLAAAGILILVLAAIVIVLVRPLILERQARQQARTEMATIAGGTAIIGTDSDDADANERPAWELQMPTFAIEKYEVSNRWYRLCVEFGDCAAPNDPTRLFDDALLDHPVVNVTVVQAAEYCKWVGRRLPTELEWEYAARGQAGREWPWGDRAPATTSGCQNANGATFPVTSHGEESTPEGIRNLCGNVWEWTVSVFAEDSYQRRDDAFWNGTYPELDEAVLVQRGGSIRSPVRRITDRRNVLPYRAGVDAGFRCVSDALSR